MIGFRPAHDIRSWGGLNLGPHQLATPYWRDEVPGLIRAAATAGMSILPSGLHRSYGDSGLNPGGALIDMTGLDRMISFDPATRVLGAEAGMSLGAIARLMLPRGYFLPVTPGTRHVTLGGAIANDVHGKNHHRNGTIGRWIRRLHLLRSSGEEIALDAADKSGLLAATVGGLGLTGVILRAEIELVPVTGAMIDAETIPFSSIAEFFSLSRESERAFEHTVAWIDCLAKPGAQGRGLFIRGNHAGQELSGAGLGGPRLSVPTAFPDFVLNRYSIPAFNRLYRAAKSRRRKSAVPLASFFYPLDGIANWNLIYGRRGFYQYQAVVPASVQEQAVQEMLAATGKAGQGSFLSVLKTFGNLASPGILSFPREGTTLALDFPNNGAETLALMARLDDIVLEAGGRLYPAKDGRMTPKMFREGYKRLDEFATHVDPGLNSRFWSRMTHD